MSDGVKDAEFRVLVIDDDVDLAEYTRTILQRRAGCHVVVVNDPLRARAAARDFAPDVVLTDVVMPGMTGLELLDQLRLDQPGLPVIVMTGHQATHQEVRALHDRSNEFHRKPVDSKELVASVLKSAGAWRSMQQPA